MDNIHIRFAANLQKLRKKKDLTQEELAQKLGVTFQAVSKWENAKAAPDIFLLPTMAGIFGCTIDQLFFAVGREPIRVDKMTIGNTVFDASYFGEIDRSFNSGYAVKLEFWRLENTGNIFSHCAKAFNVLPYNNYPSIEIERGQVFVVDCHTRIGTVERRYYLADGTIWRDMPSTVEIIVDTKRD